MQTTPNIGMVIPSGDGDPFDEIPFVNALLAIDGKVPSRIADVLLNAPSSALDFVGIPQTYRALELLVYGRCDAVSATQNVGVRCNADGALRYHGQYVYGLDATVTAGNPSGGPGTAAFCAFLPAAAAGGALFGAARFLIPNYTQAVNFHALTSSFSAPINFSPGQAYGGAGGGSWWPAVVAAINRLTLIPASGNFVAGTRATLYGWA